ncbi:MAG: hypothetical protein VYB46_03110 [Pseudomonadota bacterium]|nr:hypothetical protein [Pseudomonadota bacterium]
MYAQRPDRIIEALVNGLDLSGQLGGVSPRTLRHPLDHLRVNAADLHYGIDGGHLDIL